METKRTDSRTVIYKVFSKRNFFFFFFLSLILNIFLSSCDDDGYSLGNFVIDYGVIQKSGNEYMIRLDGGAVLYPSVSYYPSDYLKDKERILVDFTVLQDADSTKSYDYYVKVNELYKILTKDILDYSLQNSDSLGHDPVFLNDIWIKNGYITFDFFFGAGQPGLKHMVNLAKHVEKTDDGRILLDFRHNAFDDVYNYRFRGLVAFPAEQITEGQQDSVQLRIRYDGYDKEQTMDIAWHMKTNKLTGKHSLSQGELLEFNEILR